MSLGSQVWRGEGLSALETVACASPSWDRWFCPGQPFRPLPSAGSPQGSRPGQQPGALFPTPKSPGGVALSSSVLAGLEASSSPPSLHPPHPGPKHLLSFRKVNLSILFPIASRKPTFPRVPGKPTSIRFLRSVWARAEYSRNSTKNRLEASLEGFLEEVALELGLKELSGELAGSSQLEKMT